MYSFLTVNITNVTSKHREIVYTELAELNYSKLPVSFLFFASA